MTETIDPGATTGRETVPTSVRMPQSLLDALTAMATHRSISRAELIVRVVENMMELRRAGVLPDDKGTLVKYGKPCEHPTHGPICGVCGTKIN